MIVTLLNCYLKLLNCHVLISEIMSPRPIFITKLWRELAAFCEVFFVETIELKKNFFLVVSNIFIIVI